MSEEGNGRKALLVVGIAVVERARARSGAQLPFAVARTVLVYFLHSLLRWQFPKIQPISERWRKMSRK